MSIRPSHIESLGIASAMPVSMHIRFFWGPTSSMSLLHASLPAPGRTRQACPLLTSPPFGWGAFARGLPDLPSKAAACPSPAVPPTPVAAIFNNTENARRGWMSHCCEWPAELKSPFQRRGLEMQEWKHTPLISSFNERAMHFQGQCLRFPLPVGCHKTPLSLS